LTLGPAGHYSPPAMLRGKELLRLVVGAALALGLLWLVLRDQDPRHLWELVRRASLPGLLASAVVGQLQVVPRVLRWRALLDPVRRNVPVRPMTEAILVGYMTTWILPGRIGELVRPLVLAGKTGLPVGPCLGSVVADRLLDLWAIVVLFAAGLWIVPLPEGSESLAKLRLLAPLLFGGAVALLAAMAALAAYRDLLVSRLSGTGGLLAWAARAALALSQGADAMRRPALLARIALHSLLVWLTIDLGTWLGVRAAGADVSFGAILVVMPALAFGIAIPTPGGVGGYHVAMRESLRWFSVPKDTAVGVGFLMHLVVVLPAIVVGLVALRTSGLHLAELRRAVEGLSRLGAAVPPSSPAEATP
jgi:uncharacterized membrane protein YbhN (UPF0104 family)